MDITLSYTELWAAKQHAECLHKQYTKDHDKMDDDIRNYIRHYGSGYEEQDQYKELKSLIDDVEISIAYIENTIKGIDSQFFDMSLKSFIAE